MQSFNQSAIKHKLGLLNLAVELGNAECVNDFETPGCGN